LLPFAALALFRRPAAAVEIGLPRAAALWPLLGVVADFFLLGVVFIGSPRLRLPCETSVLLLAAWGVLRLLETARRWAFWAASGAWLAANLLVFFFSESLRGWLRGVL
ncbi:MAG: hypothetical protein HYU28_12945, partial [Actinobacteria bacterium]|nr:hypothetical protein [Actinomycetota bacterium]